jgi:hypothetical protein
VLLTDKNDILEHAPDAYKSQFRKRCHHFDEMDGAWSEIYRPIDKIDHMIYNDIDITSSKEEWAEALSDCKSKLAPGASTIGYNVIKKLSTDTHTVLRHYASWCYILQQVPLKWKSSTIYPISKPVE